RPEDKRSETHGRHDRRDDPRAHHDGAKRPHTEEEDDRAQQHPIPDPLTATTHRGIPPPISRPGPSGGPRGSMIQPPDSQVEPPASRHPAAPSLLSLEFRLQPVWMIQRPAEAGTPTKTLCSGRLLSGCGGRMALPHRTR